MAGANTVTLPDGYDDTERLLKFVGEKRSNPQLAKFNLIIKNSAGVWEGYMFFAPLSLSFNEKTLVKQPYVRVKREGNEHTFYNLTPEDLKVWFSKLVSKEGIDVVKFNWDSAVTPKGEPSFLIPETTPAKTPVGHDYKLSF